MRLGSAHLRSASRSCSPWQKLGDKHCAKLPDQTYSYTSVGPGRRRPPPRPDPRPRPRPRPRTPPGRRVRGDPGATPPEAAPGRRRPGARRRVICLLSSRKFSNLADCPRPFNTFVNFDPRSAESTAIFASNHSFSAFFESFKMILQNFPKGHCHKISHAFAKLR